MLVVPLLNSSICYFNFYIVSNKTSMNSSVIVCDLIFSHMRIICKSSIYIVKNSNNQQAVGGVAVHMLMLGMQFKSCNKVLFFSKLMNSFTNEFIE